MNLNKKKNDWFNIFENLAESRIQNLHESIGMSVVLCEIAQRHQRYRTVTPAFVQTAKQTAAFLKN